MFNLFELRLIVLLMLKRRLMTYPEFCANKGCQNKAESTHHERDMYGARTGKIARLCWPCHRKVDAMGPPTTNQIMSHVRTCTEDCGELMLRVKRHAEQTRAFPNTPRKDPTVLKVRRRDLLDTDSNFEAFKTWLRHDPGKAKERARVFLDEERSDFPAECNMCNGPITNGEFATGAAVLNGVGEMWHKRCEDE